MWTLTSSTGSVVLLFDRGCAEIVVVEGLVGLVIDVARAAAAVRCAADAVHCDVCTDGGLKEI